MTRSAGMASRVPEESRFRMAASTVAPTPLDCGIDASTVLSRQLAQCGGVEQFDRASLNLDQTFLLEAREKAAHRFELEPEIAADLIACHTQDELRRGVSALVVSVREIEQEHRESLLCAHAAEQQHDVVVADDLARQDAMQVFLQRWKPMREFFKLPERSTQTSMSSSAIDWQPCRSWPMPSSPRRSPGMW